MEGWLHRGCQKWNLAKVPFAPPPPWRSGITSDGWEGAGKWASRGKSWERYCFSLGKKDFSMLPRGEVTMLMAWAAGRDVSGLPTLESEICLDLSPLVSSSARGKKLLIGKYWALCKYFTPLRWQWQILCGILCVRWWFCDGEKKKKTGELFKYRSRCEKSLRSLSWISFPKPCYPTSLGFFMINAPSPGWKGTWMCDSFITVGIFHLADGTPLQCQSDANIWGSAGAKG